MDQQNMAGKVVIVTGAGQGLGEAIARTLGAAGAVVCGCDIQEDRVKNVATAIKDAGGRLIHICWMFVTRMKSGRLSIALWQSMGASMY